MIASQRRALIRVRNNLWLIVGAGAVIVSSWYMLASCVRLGARLARVML